MFGGSIPALITPFKNGEFDEKLFRKFASWQIGQATKVKAAMVAAGLLDN